MSIEIKQHLKLSQQLVMTPQLQQAIKLLQLSRMELVDLVREEMMENHVLEDGVETGKEQSKELAPVGEGDADTAPETERPMPENAQEPPTAKEVTGTDNQAVGEIDWENYLDNYS